MKLESIAKKSLIKFVVFVVLILVGDVLAQTGEEIKTSFSFAKPSITLHEPIMVNFSIENGLSEAINLDLGKYLIANFGFTIIHPDGSKIKAPEYNRWSPGPRGKISVEPKGLYTRQILFNEWYQITKPGKYIIEAELRTEIKTVSGNIIVSRVFESMPLDVQERDSVKLREVVEALARTATRRVEAVESGNAVLALSHIPDPMVVPHLIEIIDGGFWDEQGAAVALGRIGTPDAIAYLKAAAEDDSRSEDIRRYARRALRKIKLK